MNKKESYVSAGKAEIADIYKAVLKGEEEIVEQCVHTALASGMAASNILSDGLIGAMAEVGRLFERQEYYVPEILMSAQAMQAGVRVLRPLLGKTGAPPAGKVVLGTVKDDIHDIGKNLVVMMLEGSGFCVADLGVDVSAERFVQAAHDGAQVIGMSAMLPVSMPNMKRVIDALKDAGLRDRVKVVVGGAPLTQGYADQIGADGYAPDAGATVHKVRELMSSVPDRIRGREASRREILVRCSEVQRYV